MKDKLSSRVTGKDLHLQSRSLKGDYLVSFALATMPQALEFEVIEAWQTGWLDRLTEGINA